MRLRWGERSSASGRIEAHYWRRAGTCFALLALAWLNTAAAAVGPDPETLTLWNRHIVTFRAVVGGNGPAQRLANAQRRLDALADHERVQPVTAAEATVGRDHGWIVSVGSQAVFGVVQGDVDPESGLTLEQLVRRAEGELRAALMAQAEQRNPSVMFRGIGFSVLATLAVIAISWLVRKLQEGGVRRLDAFLKRLNLVVAGVDIVPTLATLERALLRVAGWGIIVAIVYLLVVFILQQFPYSAPLGYRLGAYLRENIASGLLSVVRWLPSLALVIAVLLVTRAVAVWISRMLAEVEQGVRAVSWLQVEQARATRRIAVWFVWALGVVIAYPLLPWANNLIFQAFSVVFGVGLSLASTGLVSQWISGLAVLYSRSFRIGDFVAIGETEGVVTEMGSLAVKLRTIKREEIVVPNSVITSGRLVNYTRLGEGAGAMFGVRLSIGYDVPWRQVNELLLRAASETRCVRREPPPRVLQWELSDFSVTYQLDVNLERSEDRLAVRSELNARILDTFAAAGVQIMTPHFEGQPENPVIAPVSAS